MEKLDLRTASKETKEAIRLRAIGLVEEGKTQKEIASLLCVNKNSVNTWYKNFKKYGYQGLKEKPQGHKEGIGRLLTKEQEKQVQELIIDKMPDQLKLPFALWTRRAIVELIKREFGIPIAIRTMGIYLGRWGFTAQKPKKKAYEKNNEAVKKWFEEEYPKIKEQAKQEKAEIHWGDETGVKNECQDGRSYAPKGKTSTRTKMGKRLSLNIISTITNQGKVRFMTYKGTMNSAMLIKFLTGITKGKKKKIYLILDNLKVLHSNPVKRWMEKNTSKIALFFLPSYSPERNPMNI
ncbi:hypothetical protein BMS3Abin04_00957 [bacterium BMS3Abin04]|nr:hypothetical protein BMS3Abin04_00957 [bacterium BMS3Abin04]